jgi:hypothetical protein
MRYDNLTDFTKTATRRLDDARELLTDPAHEAFGRRALSCRIRRGVHLEGVHHQPSYDH